MQDKITHVKTLTNEYDIEVEWDLTARCNYSCSYCKSYDNTQPLLLKSLAEYEDVIDYLISYFFKKRIKIDFLGGEPTLFKDWANILEYIHMQGHVPKITTNLAIPIKTLKEKLNNKTFKECIDVSFHPEFAESDNFIDKVKFLYNEGFLKAVSILMHPDHWEIGKKVYNELEYTGKVSYIRIRNEDTQSVSIASSIINYTAEQKKLLDKPNKRTDLKITEVHYGNKVKYYKGIEELLANDITDFKGMHCYIGTTRLHIKPNGDAYPSACLLNYSKSRMGNVYKNNLKNIENAIICPFSFCGCGPDMRIEKKTI